MFTHPRDEEIRATYLSGLGITSTAKALCLGKRVVEYAIQRLGIVRKDAKTKTGHIDWALAETMYRAGHGTKAIAKQAGGCHPAIREGLISRGIYQHNRPTKPANANSLWAGYYEAEIAPNAKHEREHQSWWRKANPSQKNHALEYYYANHEENKAKCAQRAKAKYYAIRHTPEFRAAKFARNQLVRISKQGKKNIKNRRTHEYLGCTYAEAAAHITALLPSHWTWENYAKEWEIDHIVQLSDGSMLDQAHIARVCHYTNLRPMAVTANRTRAKGSFARIQCVV